MDGKEILEKLVAIVGPEVHWTRCLCGHFESCEVCNSTSEYNKLLTKLLKLIDECNG